MVSVTVELAMTNPGESITVREDGTGNLYEYDFPTLEVAVNRIVAADGKVIENPGKMSLTNFTGTEHIESGDSFKLSQTGAADQLTMNVDYADEQGAAVIVATMADLVYNADSIVAGWRRSWREYGPGAESRAGCQGRLQGRRDRHQDRRDQ